MSKLDEKYMFNALDEAKKALTLNEIPVGAIIVDSMGNIIGRGFNETERTKQATNHAEIIAIKNASKTVQSWRLDDMTLYVTLEPCIMCYGAIIESRISRLVYGAKSTKKFSIENLHNMQKTKINITEGVLAVECKNILDSFFLKIRGRNKNE